MPLRPHRCRPDPGYTDNLLQSLPAETRHRLQAQDRHSHQQRRTRALSAACKTAMNAWAYHPATRLAPLLPTSHHFAAAMQACSPELSNKALVLVRVHGVDPEPHMRCRPTPTAEQPSRSPELTDEALALVRMHGIDTLEVLHLDFARTGYHNALDACSAWGALTDACHSSLLQQSAYSSVRHSSSSGPYLPPPPPPLPTCSSVIISV